MIHPKFRVNKVVELRSDQRHNNPISMLSLPHHPHCLSPVKWDGGKEYMVPLLSKGSIFNSVKGVCIGKRELTFTEFSYVPVHCTGHLGCILLFYLRKN